MIFRSIEIKKEKPFAFSFSSVQNLCYNIFHISSPRLSFLFAIKVNATLVCCSNSTLCYYTCLQKQLDFLRRILPK